MVKKNWKAGRGGKLRRGERGVEWGYASENNEVRA